MDAFLPYLIWAVLILIVLGLAAIVLFGVRGLTYGKADPFTIGAFLLPGVIFALLGFVMGDWIEAGVVTLLVMLGLTGLALLFSGLRGATT